MTHQYITRSRREIMKVIYILNGMLQLSKRKAQLAEFVERYNKHFGHNIVVAPSKDLIALDRGWLTGMTEAEGCFTVTLQQPTAGRIARAEAGAKKKREKAEKKLEESKTEKERAKAARRIAESNEEKSLSYQVMVRYVITQKDEEAVLKTIAEVLGGKVSGKNMTVQLTAADTVIEYLSRYPMRGKKREAYEIWCNIRKMALAKLHLTGELEKIRVEAEKLKKLNGNKGDLVKLAETEQEES